MPVFDDPPIADWTGPLYNLKQAWAECSADVNAISQSCRDAHGTAVAIQCRACHGAIVDRIQRVFHSPPPGAWFRNRAGFLAELNTLFARARVYDADMRAVSARIAAEKTQWYRDMVTQYPLLIAVLESAHASDHVARLLGTDREMPAAAPGQPPLPVEFDFEELSEAVAAAIGPPKDRHIGPAEVEQYATRRRGCEDDAAKLVAANFLFHRPSDPAPDTSDTQPGSDKPPPPPPPPDPVPPSTSTSTATPTSPLIPGTERYAQIYQDPSVSIERLMSIIEADLRRTSSTTGAPTSHQHSGPPDRRRALGLGTATPLTPEQRQRVDQLVRIMDAQARRAAELAAMTTRMAELQRAKRANEEDAARRRREKAAAEEKRRAEAIRAAEAEAKAKARAAAAAHPLDKPDADDPKKIPAAMYDKAPCCACAALVDPKAGPSLGCAICVLGTLAGRVPGQTLYCSEACYNKGHEAHVKEAHPCESGASCIRLAPTAPSTPAAPGPSPPLGAGAPPTPTTTTHQPNGALDSTTAVACLMCDVRLKRNSFFCCLACAKTNKDAHIANFHRDAFADGRGMPKTLVLEDFLAKRLDVFVKGAKMEFAGRR
ncbi:uncharacterized protein BROUX77_004967 [Berkeleyomyces rouxiae]|uniref:uncharacterized protein n=1 Tax=Berkeleyomyces rouxiae TaxID=2035830 RepID=UPI003B810679